MVAQQRRGDHRSCFLGIAWLEIRGNKRPEAQDVQVFTNWDKMESQKVPSAISYMVSKNKCQQWGHDIDENSEYLTWTKLELGEQPQDKELENLAAAFKGIACISSITDRFSNASQRLQSLAATPGQIVQKYLTKVARKWRDDFVKSGRTALSELPLDLVVTHPAVRPHLLSSHMLNFAKVAENECRIGIMLRRISSSGLSGPLLPKGSFPVYAPLRSAKSQKLAPCLSRWTHKAATASSSSKFVLP
jgi:hypothetical protein